MKNVDTKYDVHIFICHGSKCSKNGADDIRSNLRKALKNESVKAKISKTSCQSLCKKGCIVFAQGKDSKQAWQEVKARDADQLAQQLST